MIGLQLHQLYIIPATVVVPLFHAAITAAAFIRMTNGCGSEFVHAVMQAHHKTAADGKVDKQY